MFVVELTINLLILIEIIDPKTWLLFMTSNETYL